FKTVALNRSATLPFLEARILTKKHVIAKRFLAGRAVRCCRMCRETGRVYLPAVSVRAVWVWKCVVKRVLPVMDSDLLL
ncbi:hypothetical protein, partial [Neisseria sp.]|uniref:hypothetical protein n=1 Tax=Neisseria sp. TaxID=192066 RepID=UPI0035A1A70D